MSTENVKGTTINRAVSTIQQTVNSFLPQVKGGWTIQSLTCFYCGGANDYRQPSNRSLQVEVDNERGDSVTVYVSPVGVVTYTLPDSQQ